MEIVTLGRRSGEDRRPGESRDDDRIDGKAAAKGAVRDIEVKAADGLMLRGRWWRRGRAPAASSSSLTASANMGAAIVECRLFIARRQQLEVDVVAVDLRGHGRSPGRRGVVRRYEDLTDDVSCAVSWVARNRPDVPRFLLGHSNGGQVALRVALERRAPVDGLIISNPALRIAGPIPAHKLMLGRFLLRYAPWVTAPVRTARRTLDPRRRYPATATRRSAAVAQPDERPALLRHGPGRRDADRSARRGSARPIS